MKILAISGSLRAASHNTALLREAAALAPEGIEIELYEELEQLPPYNEDRDTDALPAEARRLRRRLRDADAVLFATPEYNGTVPGQLKHAIDWGSRPRGQSAALWGKPVAVIGASTGQYGAMWAQNHLRQALGLAGARVLDAELAVAKAHERFNDEGELEDAETRGQLEEILMGLAAYTPQLAQAA